MTHNYVVETPEARVLQVIHVARHDLQITQRMIALALSDFDHIEDVEEAAWTSAAIRYVRAWKSGPLANDAWEDAMTCLSGEESDLHRHVLTIRDTMYAHHVGVGTDMTVTANVGLGHDGLMCLWGLGVQSARVSSPGRDAAQLFALMLEKIVDVFQQHEKSAHAVALADLRRRPSADWITGGLYKRDLHFDQSSPKYMRESKKR